MTAPHRVEICNFPGDKRIAMTFSFDDGVLEDRRVIAYMNEHGLKGTFNLNSSHLGVTGKPVSPGHIGADEIPGLYHGHEVAIHTHTHPHLPKLSSVQVAQEVLRDQEILEDIVGYPVRGMAYPYGTYSPKVIQVLRALDIVYSRTTQRVEICFPPDEPLAWHTTSHMFTCTPETSENVAQRFTKWHDAPRKTGVFFIWGHTYEFARPRDRWAELPQLFGPLAGHDDVWYCTNIQLFDYQAARQHIVIAANRKTALNPSALPVALRVDGQLVEVPGGQTVSLENVKV